MPNLPGFSVTQPSVREGSHPLQSFIERFSTIPVTARLDDESDPVNTAMKTEIGVPRARRAGVIEPIARAPRSIARGTALDRPS